MTSFFSAQDCDLVVDCSFASLNSAREISADLKASAKSRPDYDALKALEKSKEVKKIEGFIIIYFQGINVIAMQDINEHGQRIEVASLSIGDMILALDSKQNQMNVNLYIGDLQFDNQMFEQGGFDFPVVLISQKPPMKKGKTFYLSNCLRSNIKHITESSLIAVDFNFEIDGRKKGTHQTIVV